MVDNFSYVFKKKDRIGIVGKNGIGKSTFLDLLTSKTKPTSGEMIPGITTKIGYFTQEVETLNPAHRVIEEIKEIAEYITMSDGTQMSASKFLDTFLFPPEKQYNYIEKLSGGEKKRLQLMKVLITNPNFLILDEPTNDFDIDTLNVLEDFLEKFTGCLLLVSHDRYFMDHLVDQLFIFEGDGKIKPFNGNYSDYRTWLEEKEEAEKAPAVTKKVTEEKSGGKKKVTFLERNEFDQLPLEIEHLELLKSEFETLLNAGSTNHQQLADWSTEIGKLNEQIELKTLRWMELGELVN
jgi:ATP-binding cassette subfamily F protein uup